MPLKRKAKGRKKPRTTRQKLMDRIDETVAQLCKERSNWQCEWCGRDFSGNRRQLHWSHNKPRRKSIGVRWLAINCFSHCMSCHLYRWHGKNQADDGNQKTLWHLEHAERHWQGRLTLELIEELAERTVKYTIPDLEDILEHYQGELKRVRALRAQGVMERLEWEDWD